MPALACSVDAAVLAPPGYAAVPAGDGSFLPSPVDFPGGSHSQPTLGVEDQNESSWSTTRSSSLYKVDAWGAPYFSVNSSGHVAARPHGVETLPHQEIDLFNIVKKVTDPISFGGLGLDVPLIVRLPDVLKNRLESLQSAFDFAICSHGYRSYYQGLYPVKCNQDKFVVDDIVRFGFPFRFGLEAGSKPELLLAMSCLCKGHPDALLVCNGYKDSEFIYLALLARKMALNTVIVLEQEEELDLVIDMARKLGVRPVIGVRAKLKTKHCGHFGSTSGENGKFGLKSTQILGVVRRLKRENMLDCFQLLHFHIGSQIPSTELIDDGVREAAQIYCELVRLGAFMQFIDVGGGLGIDYDGSKSGNSDLSVAYGLEEYALAVVRALKSVFDMKNVKHPMICSESGRALVSHHSVLIFEALSTSISPAPPLTPYNWQYIIEGLTEEARADYRSLISAAVRGEYDTCFTYIDKLKQRCVELFKEGEIGMEQLAAVDDLSDLIAQAIRVADPVRTYHLNLSIFTSIPDCWAMGQLFPIMPIHRLGELPSVKGRLSDITCDSDGKMEKFINGDSSLPLHEIDSSGSDFSSRYYLGMFLGGAYQEAIGGRHNLFGGPTVVRVTHGDGPHGFAVTHVIPGQSCSDVLRMMQHEPQLMFQTLKHRIEEFCQQDQEGSDDGGFCEDLMEAATLINQVDEYFHKTPYLVSCSLTAINDSPYFCSDDSYGSATDSPKDEEDQWPLCYA